MNTIKRFKLHQLREKIVQDVDVKYIMDHLIQCNVITNDDVKQINSELERSDQTRHLLDLLPLKGADAFDNFIESLRRDYHWLYEEFTVNTSHIDSFERDEQSFYDALLLGGVPHPPPYNVTRKKKLREVRENLTNLKRGNYIVLHGMTGSGKSCLAAAAMYDRNLIMGSFKATVFWLSIGLCDDNELLSEMNQLLIRINFNLSHNDVTREVISTKERAKEELKRSFVNSSLREGLLILDDVTSTEHIDWFDIGCKILVITKDLEVMKKARGRYQCIQVSEGFTENESLSLMALSIDIPVSKLPLQAKSIHIHSQGCPMIIALIAGQLEENKEDARSSKGRWEFYVNMLSERNFSNFKRNSFSAQNGLFETISLSINNLPEDKRHYYLDFAVFMEDVNIKPEVLQTLWSLNTKYEVENIMAYFTKKSLAVCKWNEQLQSSVYGIHDLLLHYLKEQLNDEGWKELHRKLLRKYREKCGRKFAKLPNDNYIFSFIGYHMYQADEVLMFPEVFLDLEFIQVKLRINGPADVLGDFKKYRNQITNENPRLIQELEDLCRFVQVYGLDLHRCEEMDIIQCGLFEKKDSYVYRKAYEISKRNPQKLYIESLSDQAPVSYPLSLPLRDEIFAACFTHDKKNVLVGDGLSMISLWKLDTLEMMYMFKGHLQKITYLVLHPDSEKFLSCSEDGSVKLWSLDCCVINNKTWLNTAGGNLIVSSPKCLQSNWNSMFLDDSPKDESLKTFSKHDNPVMCAVFSHSGKVFVSCSKSNCVIWDCERGNDIFTVESCGTQSFSSCSFSNDDSLLFLGDKDSQVSIYDYTDKSLDFIAKFCNSSSVVSIFSDPFEPRKLITVCLKDIIIWHWEESNTSNPIDEVATIIKQIHSFKAFSMGKISQFGEKSASEYVCATASGDGLFLVAGSTDYIISVWNLKTRTLIAEHKYYSGLARCLDTYWNNDSIPLLLCGSADRTVKVWHLDEPSTDNFVSLMADFDSTWMHDKLSETWQPIIASYDSKHKLQIFFRNEFIGGSSEEDEQITVCKVTNSGCFVFYGCVTGDVKKFDIKEGSAEIIMRLDSTITFLEIHENVHATIVVAGDINSLKLWKEGGCISVCYGQTSPVVQSFLMPGCKLLLACNEDASVKLWNIENGQLIQIVTGRKSEAHITCTDMSETCNLLVMGDQRACFFLITFTVNTDIPFLNIGSLKMIDINEKDKMQFGEQSIILCCKISHDCTLLALGLQSGQIMVWNLKTLRLVRMLGLHYTPVHSVLFAPYREVNSDLSPCILISLAEKIAWWNLSDLYEKHHSNRSCELSNPLLSLTNEDINKLEVSNDKGIQNLFHKEGCVKNSNLLVCVKLVGSNARRLSFSPDFSYFVTVDNTGIVYLLKVLE